MRVRLAHSPTRMEVTPRNSHRELKVGAYASRCPYTATASPLLVGCGLAYLLNRNQYPNHHQQVYPYLDNKPSRYLFLNTLILF